MTPAVRDRWFAAGRIGIVAAGVLAVVRLATGGPAAVFDPPGSLLLALVAGTLLGFAILSLRGR